MINDYVIIIFVVSGIFMVYLSVIPILIHLHLRKQTKYLKLISEK